MRMNITRLLALLAALPMSAEAHPGHSAFDFTAGPPHAGHESEIATLFIAAGLTMMLFAVAHWLVAGRRR
jgi:hypothetical protein